MWYKIAATKRFLGNIVDYDISNYFGLGESLRCKYEMNIFNHNVINLTFLYTHKTDNLFLLPEEISKHIYSFLEPDFITFTLEIYVPENFPLMHPIWSLKDLNTEAKNKKFIYNYIKHRLNLHNHQYRLYGFPSVTLEKNILDFITKINHLEYLFFYFML